MIHFDDDWKAVAYLNVLLRGANPIKLLIDSVPSRLVRILLKQGTSKSRNSRLP